MAPAEVTAGGAGPRLGDVRRPARERLEQVADDVLGRQALDELGLVERDRELVGDRAQELVGLLPKGGLDRDAASAPRCSSPAATGATSVVPPVGAGRGGAAGRATRPCPPGRPRARRGRRGRRRRARGGPCRGRAGRAGRRRSPGLRARPRSPRGRAPRARSTAAIACERLDRRVSASTRRRVSSYRRAFSIAPATSEAVWARNVSAPSSNSRGATVCRTTVPSAGPDRAGIGTATIDWKRSSSISGKYFIRGSARAWSRMNSGRALARDPAREALVEAHVDLADEVRVDPRRGAQPQPLAVAQVDEAGVAVGRLAQEVDDAVEDAVEVGGGGHDPDDRVQRLASERRDGAVRRRRRRPAGAITGSGLASVAIGCAPGDHSAIAALRRPRAPRAGAPRQR